MPDVHDEIDELVSAAAKAHEALAGADYFEDLPARVLARLEHDERFSEVSMMSDTTSKDSPQGSSLPANVTGPGGPTEDSGLHDMKALAHTAKLRISRRVTSQHDAYDESLLSSSQSGLKAVALPAPAQMVALPDLPRTAVAADIEARSAAGVAPIPVQQKSRAMWFIGGGLLAAAAAAAFIVAGGGGKKKSDDGQVATAVVPSTGGAPASGAAETGYAAGTAAAAAPQMAAPPTTATVVTEEKAAAPADPGTAASDKSDRAVARGSAAASGADRALAVGRTDAKGGGTAADKADGGKKPGKLEEAGKKAGPGDKAAGGDKATGGAPAGGGGDQSIEDLLNAASGGAQKATDNGGGGGGGEVKPEKTSLDGKDIKAGMGAVKGQAQGCYDQYNIPGLVKIKATVDPSGKVTKADATGEFAGTPTGTCVANAVKGASFATWTGGPMTVSYGFTLVE